MMKAALILALMLFAALAVAQPEVVHQESGSQQHGGPPHAAALRKAMEACKASAHQICSPPTASVDNVPEIALAGSDAASEAGSDAGSDDGVPPPPPFGVVMCLFSHINDVDAECKAALDNVPKPPQEVISAFEACHDSIPEECAPREEDAPADATETEVAHQGRPRGPHGPRGILACLKRNVDDLEGACKAAVEALPERPHGGPHHGPRGGARSHGRPRGGHRGSRGGHKGSHGQHGPRMGRGEEDSSALRGHGADTESELGSHGNTPQRRHGGRHRVWKLVAAGVAAVVAVAVIALVVRRVRRKRRATTIANGIVIRKDGFQSVATNPASAEAVKGSSVALV